MKWLLVGAVVLMAGRAAREPGVRTVRVEVPVPPDSLEIKVRALLAER